MAISPLSRSVFDLSKNFLSLPVLLLAGVVLLSGCHPAVTDPNDPKFIVAEKGKDWQITRDDLNKEITTVLKQHQTTAEQIGPDKMLEVQSSLLKNMVLKNLLLAKAATLQLTDVDKDAATELDTIKNRLPPGTDLDQQLKTIGMTLDDVKKQIHDKVVIEKLLKADAFKNDDPTEQEINDFYLKNKASITAPPQVRASRVLVHVDVNATPAEKAAKKKIIDKAYDRVMHGEEFSKVAMQVSEDRSSAPKGGDLGYFQPGENPDAGFDNYAFGTKLGTVSPVFETPLGYQFLKVTDIKPGGVVALADVRPKIEAFLRESKMQKQGEDYVKNMLDNSGVVYNIKLVEPSAQVGPGGAGAPNGAPPPPAPESAAPSEAPTAPASTNSAPAK